MDMCNLNRREAMKLKNQMILSGNLGQDPLVINRTNGGFVVLKIAVNRDYYDFKNLKWIKKDPDWFDVYAHDIVAEKTKFLKKGDFVHVEGALTTVEKIIGEKKVKLLLINAESVNKIEKSKQSVFPNVPDFNETREVEFETGS